MLEPGQTFLLDGGRGRRVAIAEARAAGYLDVDLSDEWAPFIFSESDGPSGATKPQFYRQSFIDLANDRVAPSDLVRAGPTHPLETAAARAVRLAREQEEARLAARRRRRAPDPTPKPPARNYLEVFGIPPTLSVLATRVAGDASRGCEPPSAADDQALRAWDGEVTYQSHEQARREFAQAEADRAWIASRWAASARDAGVSLPDAGTPSDAWLDALAADPKLAARIERYRRGQRRVAAVRAAQALLVCADFLSPRARFVPGQFDLPTHEALATFERANDIFGWGFLNPDTATALLTPALARHHATFRRILTERIADAAGIIEDGSATGGRKPASYVDEQGARQPVPNLIEDFTNSFIAATGLTAPEHVAGFLQRLGGEGRARLHVAWKPPALPPYYAAEMNLSVEIDRGDVWYDFPWDTAGKAIEQRRERYPSLALYTTWRNQRILLARWRTTIGSWRSEMHADGHVYYKYKNSDVGPRIWRDIVAAPVWIPPDGTPSRDLLTRRVLDPHEGPVTTVNTDVMGPGFASAYGLVMAIHHQVTRGGGLFDNQIRTHGSVDYTSIARRFSHGCHRIVNVRAVRLFGFVLRHHAFERLGAMPLAMKRWFDVDGQAYGYAMNTRGYLYRLRNPIPVQVLEGRVMGAQKAPIASYVRKAGVDYSDLDDAATEATPTNAAASSTVPIPAPFAAPNEAPAVGP